MATAMMYLPVKKVQRLEEEEAERHSEKGGEVGAAGGTTKRIQDTQDESGLLAAARAEIAAGRAEIAALRAENATLRSVNSVGARQDA